MKRDDDILKIKSCLDKIVRDDNKRIEYEAIMTLANHSMNIDIHIGDDGIHHEVFWFNRKVPGSSSFDDDLSKLVGYINKLIEDP